MAGAAALASVAALATACGTSSNAQSASSASSAAPGSSAASSTTSTSTVMTEHTSLGTVLADSQGRTLYMLTADHGGTSSCAGGCLSVWPAAKASGTPHAGNGVTATLGTTADHGGGMLITADGHPLYAFSGDSGPDQANGQGQQSFGGTWYVLSASGTPIKASAPASSNGGGGY
jgi:predicted lipoprotein with Yx(FWY)xxD motif